MTVSVAIVNRLESKVHPVIRFSHTFFSSLHLTLQNRLKSVTNVNWLGYPHVSWISSMLTMGSLFLCVTVRQSVADCGPVCPCLRSSTLPV